MYHGWADPGPAPENTINYYEAVIKKLGGKQDDWMRLFLMPGVGHCGGGVGPDQADFLGALERWREQGVAPGQIIATRPAGRGGSATPMSRPLCPHPQVARYTGSGRYGRGEELHVRRTLKRYRLRATGYRLPATG